MVEMTAGADNILDCINRNLHSKTEKCHCELYIQNTSFKYGNILDKTFTKSNQNMFICGDFIIDLLNPNIDDQRVI